MLEYKRSTNDDGIAARVLNDRMFSSKSKTYDAIKLYIRSLL